VGSIFCPQFAGIWWADEDLPTLPDFGFKNHVQIDNQHKLIRDYAVTDASVHDSNVFEE
jgi:hypothetical protein